GLDDETDTAEELGQLEGAQGQSRDHAQTAATAALEAPEQLGVRAGVGDAYLAVGGDDFCLQQVGCRGTPALRQAAETAALHQPGHAHRGAAAALHVAAAAGGYRVVGVDPHRTRLHAHRRLR